MKKSFQVLTGLGFLLFSCITVFSQGSSRAIDFSANSAGNNGVNIGLCSALDTIDFTIEFWAKPIAGTPGGGYDDGPFMANKNWDNGTNTGLVICQNVDKIKVNIKGAVGGRRDFLSKAVIRGNGWMHIALSVDRQGLASLYINGILDTSYSVSPTTGSIIGTLPFYLGQDGTGTYAAKCNASMDEVRIWQGVRSDTLIRTFMCRRLSGTEAGLYRYFRMDEVSGTVITDSGPFASNGTLNNSVAGNRVFSGASIGDTSTVFYHPSWTGISHSIITSKGEFVVDSVIANNQYLHLYSYNAIPLNAVGLSALDTTPQVFGMFLSNGTFTSRGRARYLYGSYPTAVSYETSLTGYSRDNGQNNWNASAFIKDTINNRFTKYDTLSVEFVPGNFTVTCALPDSFRTLAVNATSAQLNWRPNGAGAWNIDYATSPHTPGAGTIISSVSSYPYTLTGLNSGSTYYVYIQATCPGIGTTTWVGPITFTTTYDSATIGAGYCVDFSKNSASNNRVLVGNLPSIGSTNFTIEFWTKAAANTPGGGFDDAPFFSNKNWNSGANTGLTIFLNSSGQAAVNFKGASGGRKDFASSIQVRDKGWNHVAITFNRSGNAVIYINGIPTDSTDISSSSGSIDGTLPYYIGQDGTGTYASKMRSSVDELRVWNVIRTQNQIRTNMCRKLKGDEAGLLRYFRFDESSGTLVRDYSTASTHGTFENLVTGNRRLSGAAVGDTSWFVYASSWAGPTGALISNQGQVFGQKIEGNVNGFHIYFNRTSPFSRTGVNALAGVNSYFGCFPVAYQNVHAYKPVFGYAGFAAAVASESNLALYYRVNAEMPFWSLVNQTTNTASDQILADSTFGQKEMYLGLKPSSSCLPPNNIKADSILFDRAVINWTSGGSSRWNILWDTAGFISSTGNRTLNTASKPFSIGTLGALEVYEVYVQDSCAGLSSTWAGPYLITVKTCPSTDSLRLVSKTANSLVVSWSTGTSSKWVIEWGPKGFSPGTGILETVTTSPYTFPGLASKTEYDFYIKTECSSSSFSPQKGPYTYKTDSTNSTGVRVLNGNDIQIMVYPNPHQDKFTIVSDQMIHDWKLQDMSGRIVKKNEMDIQEKNCVITTQGISEGVYLLEVKVGDTIQRRVIQKH